MNSLDRSFKELLLEELNVNFIEAQKTLCLPATNELSANLHEIGVLRGYLKAMVEVSEICEEIQRKLTEPEKKA